MAYETDFDAFYRDQFLHNENLKPEDLLLNHYPFSVEINIPENGHWLELGVGSGRVVNYHAARLSESVKITGIEYSQHAVEFCKSHLPSRADIQQGDMRNLDFPTESFDLITLFGTIQAVPKHQWMSTIEDLLRLVKPNGRLGFSVHPVSGLEILRCIQHPSLFKNMTTKRFLRKQAKHLNLLNHLRIEKHHAFVLPKLVARLLGFKLPCHFGFYEFRKNWLGSATTAAFRYGLPFFTFGHLWIWIEKPADKTNKARRPPGVAA